MVVHSRNEALMCKVFPSSLEPVAMRWFDGLEAGSIDFKKKKKNSPGRLDLALLHAIEFLSP